MHNWWIGWRIGTCQRFQTSRMTSDKPLPSGHPTRQFLKPFHWLLAAASFVLRILLGGWATLAIYYSSLPWEWLRLLLATAFLAFAVWALWLSRRKRARVLFGGLFLAVLAWWTAIQPSHDRAWRPEVAVMPRATVDGNRVRFTGVRNFDYRSRDDFTVRHEERQVLLSHLSGVDFFVSYWKEGPVGHTFLSFIFDNAPPLSVSIETRPEVGEGFAPVGSMFKQFELIYVVGDERDLVRLRTNYRDEEVFLYHTRISPAFARRLFMIYVDRINELADRAEFYHLLSNSCTVNIVRYANAAGRIDRFDFRHILNGLIDRYIYAAGVVNTDLSFDELRRRSRINPAAQAAGNAADFSERIREGLPAVASQ